jgi:uncharacterized membrane protein
MSHKPTEKRRSYVTTIIAGVIAILSLFLAIIAYTPNIIGILISLVFFGLTVLAIVIAIQGKRGALKEIIMSGIHHLTP